MKQKRLKKYESEDSSEIRNLIIITVIIALIATGLYFLTEKVLNKKENNGICNYNEYDDIGIRYIELNRIFDLTDSGKYRINADKFIEKFNVKKTSLKGEIESLEKALNEVETMIDDISNIICNMNKFNEKYPYLVQEIFGCYYQLSYEGSWNKKLLC